MADPHGFLHFSRELPEHRPGPERLHDGKEVYEPFSAGQTREQATRCMDCGVPFCHNGCPLGNLIPEWNDLVRLDRWEEASERLHATNNFPEFTGRLCPAPCEGACVLGIDDEPVTIKLIEQEIADRAISAGYGIAPRPPELETGRRVAVIGSGPAGLAAAQQLRRAGHAVTVFERETRIGGLLRYGIPEYKMSSEVLDRRLAQLIGEGVEFRANCEVGVDISTDELLATFDAVVLAIGATVARDIELPGRHARGIHLAMEYLVGSNKAVETGTAPAISAAGKNVVILGGGDTGTDCYGTALRQGAASVTQLDIRKQPPPTRDPSTPWPTYPLVLRSATPYEEGGERLFGVNSTLFEERDGAVCAIHLQEGTRIPGGFRPAPGVDPVRLDADLVLLALGFSGPERGGLVAELGVKLDRRGAIKRDTSFMTNVPKVFVAGDAGRGQSLIVWAIAEGRSAAAGVDAYLAGSSWLPEAVEPTTVPLA
jgi:glutamate synthase (NADPH/NADH) small chain